MNTTRLANLSLALKANLQRTKSQSSSGAYATKKLIATLLTHGSRSKRATYDRKHIKISCFTPQGHQAVDIKV